MLVQRVPQRLRESNVEGFAITLLENMQVGARTAFYIELQFPKADNRERAGTVMLMTDAFIYSKPYGQTIFMCAHVGLEPDAKKPQRLSITLPIRTSFLFDEIMAVHGQYDGMLSAAGSPNPSRKVLRVNIVTLTLSWTSLNKANITKVKRRVCRPRLAAVRAEPKRARHAAEHDDIGVCAVMDDEGYFDVPEERDGLFDLEAELGQLLRDEVDESGAGLALS